MLVEDRSEDDDKIPGFMNLGSYTVQCGTIYAIGILRNERSNIRTLNKFDGNKWQLAHSSDQVKQE